MKTTEDEKEVITYQLKFFDLILFRIKEKWSRFTYKFFRSRFGDWFAGNILWPVFKWEPYKLNDFDEAAINLNKELYHMALKKALKEIKEKIGEEELYKTLKKDLSRKHYKETMADIKRWKNKGDW
jgi:hypothetical protein